MNHRTLIRAALAAALFASISGCKHAETKKPVAEPAGAPDAPFRATRPAPSGELHFTPPKPEQMKLKNGLVVYTVERHDLPLVAVELVIRAGRDADPADKQGLAAFTADMLDEGAKGMDAPQIAASFEDLAIQYNAGTESGVTTVGFNTLTQNLDQALTIFGNVVLHPTFTDKDLDRVRGERLAAYTAAHDDPAEIARDVLVRSLYGDKNPLGAPTVGTVEGIKALKKADLSKFHDTWYVPSNAALVIVGDVKAADLKPLLEKHLGTWKDKKAKPVKLPEPPAAASRSVLFVDKPGAPQSQILGGPARVRGEGSGPRGVHDHERHLRWALREPREPGAARGQGMELRRVLVPDVDALQQRLGGGRRLRGRQEQRRARHPHQAHRRPARRRRDRRRALGRARRRGALALGLLREQRLDRVSALAAHR